MMRVCLLGASGSIGKQSLDVMKKNEKEFDLVSFSIGHQTRKISYILKKFRHVKFICLQEEKDKKRYQKKYPNIRFYSGDEGLIQLVISSEVDMVINALVGFAGLIPTLKALQTNHILALANKESLVVGGELIKNLLAEGKGELWPIDSEHVALAKCLAVESESVSKLILTASGGAFRKLNRNELHNVEAKDALAHPTWKMGKKITIDSATMMNKAFEIIEAHYLFDYPFDRIDVVLHDESYVHSMVKYEDGSFRLDISKPDMRNPIRYALFKGLAPFKTYKTLDYYTLTKYHFHDFDSDRYPLVFLAKIVIERKGTYGTVLNAVNEEAVYAFLDGKISFLDIENIVFTLMNEHENIIHPSLDTIIEVDRLARMKAKKLIEKGVLL